MSKRFTVFTEFKGIDKMSMMMKKIEKNTAVFRRNVKRNFTALNKGITNTSKSMQGMTVKGAAMAAGFVASFSKMASVGMDFEQSITNAAAKFGFLFGKDGKSLMEVGSKEFEDLSKKARESGASTEFSASQAADALLELAGANFEVGKAIATVDDILDLATVAQIDMGEASLFATRTMGAFGKDASKMGKVIDMMAVASSGSSAKIFELFETFKDSAAVLNQGGQTMETIGAMTGALSNMGIVGTRAGTALKNIGLVMGNVHGEKGQKLAALLGGEKELFDEKGVKLQFTEIFKKLGKALAPFSSDRRLDALKQIFGIIPVTASAGLTGEIEAMETLQKKISEGYRKMGEEGTGAAEKMAKLMRSTTLKKWEAFKSMIAESAIELFYLVRVPLTNLINKMTDWLRKNKEFLAQKLGDALLFIGDNLGKIVIAMATFVGLTAGLTALSMILNGIAVVMKLIAFLGLANPIGLIVIGVVALTAGVALMLANWEKVRAFFLAMPDWLVGAITLINAPLIIMMAVANGVINHWNAIKAVVMETIDFIKNNAAFLDYIPQVALAKMGFGLAKDGLGALGGFVKEHAFSGPQSSSVNTNNEKGVTNTLNVVTDSNTTASISGPKMKGLVMGPMAAAQ